MIVEVEWCRGTQYGNATIDLATGLVSVWPMDRPEEVTVEDVYLESLGDFHDWAGKFDLVRRVS